MKQVLLSCSSIQLCCSFHGFVAGCGKGQQAIRHFIPVLPEVGLEDGHLLLGLLLHFSAATAVGSQSLKSGVMTHKEHQDDTLVSQGQLVSNLGTFSET